MDPAFASEIKNTFQPYQGYCCMNCHLSGMYQKRFPIQAGRAYVSLKTYEKRDCNRFAACVFAALCRGIPCGFLLLQLLQCIR